MQKAITGRDPFQHGVLFPGVVGAFLKKLHYLYIRILFPGKSFLPRSSPLTLSRPQYFWDHFQMWQAHSLPYDLGQFGLWRFCLIEYAQNGPFNTLRPRQNGRHFPDNIFKWIFLNENVWISINISLKFVPMGPINNIPTLVQLMAWRRPGVSHYLNQWWLDYRRIYASLGLNELASMS